MQICQGQWGSLEPSRELLCPGLSAVSHTGSAALLFGQSSSPGQIKAGLAADNASLMVPPGLARRHGTLPIQRLLGAHLARGSEPTPRLARTELRAA